MRKNLNKWPLLSSPREGTPVNARNSWTRRNPLGSLAGWLGVAAALLFGHGEARAQTINRVSAASKFYVDDKASAGLVYNYAVYSISNNTATTFPGLYA